MVKVFVPNRHISQRPHGILVLEDCERCGLRMTIVDSNPIIQRASWTIHPSDVFLSFAVAYCGDAQKEAT